MTLSAAERGARSRLVIRRMVLLLGPHQSSAIGCVEHGCVAEWGCRRGEDGRTGRPVVHVPVLVLVPLDVGGGRRGFAPSQKGRCRNQVGRVHGAILGGAEIEVKPFWTPQRLADLARLLEEN